MTYRILSLDGGGVRGLLTATLLKKLDAEPTIANWRKGTNMIAGTSTGGLLALALGLGKSPDDIMSFYQKDAPQIFKRPLLREVTNLGNLVGAKYDNVVLLQNMKALLGANTLLRDL